MNKLAIICTGGGTRCAFGGGALVALSKELKIQPDIIIAASGNAGSACYFAANQLDEIERIWKKHLVTRKFFFIFRFWKMMDIDYLVDTVFKNLEPLNVAGMNNSKILIEIPLLNKTTKQIEYLDPKQEEIFEILRASKAMPVIYGKEVTINGTKYIDGALVTSTEHMIQRALSHGATHIVIIDNRVRNTLFLLAKKLIGGFYVNKIKTSEQFSVETKYICDKDIQGRFATTNGATLATMFDAGYQAMKENRESFSFSGR